MNSLWFSIGLLVGVVLAGTICVTAYWLGGLTNDRG